MENWNNLSIYLNKYNKDLSVYNALTRELIDACLANDKEKIKKSLKKGAYINCHDEYITPLIASIQNDNSDLAAYLLRAGAGITYRPTQNFEDAFWYSLNNKKHTFLKLFVDNRCPLQWSLPKSDKDYPKTPLIVATLNSDLESVKILLSHSFIKVNERDGLGNTALHYNLSKNPMTDEDKEIGLLLIAAGADDNIVNLNGQSPKDVGSSYEAQSILLTGKLEAELPVNEETIQEPTFDDEPKPSVTKNGKMKI